ncbi:MAG: GatB/YqeY domain-containing protein [Bacilli bacterium]|nr:GatB/YqeY domain-containing protein [Bacilli bacterium]
MFNQIEEDLKSAMKNQEKLVLSVLRMVKSALQLEKINKKEDLTDEEVLAVIKKQIKMRRDSIGEFEKFDKKEEIELLNQEIEILNQYLPEALSEEELDQKIEEVFNEIQPSGMKDMGAIMKALQPIASQVDMSEVSKKVKMKLSNI